MSLDTNSLLAKFQQATQAQAKVQQVATATAQASYQANPITAADVAAQAEGGNKNA